MSNAEHKSAFSYFLDAVLLVIPFNPFPFLSTLCSLFTVQAPSTPKFLFLLTHGLSEGADSTVEKVLALQELPRATDGPPGPCYRDPL